MPIVRSLVIAGSAIAWSELASCTPSAGVQDCARTYTVLDARPLASLRPMARRDLIGKTVREVRHAGEDQWEAVELAYGAEHFTVRFDIERHATPPVKGFSWKGSPAPGVDWNRRRAVSDNIEIGIYDGPLAELALSPDPCS